MLRVTGVLGTSLSSLILRSSPKDYIWSSSTKEFGGHSLGTEIQSLFLITL